MDDRAAKLALARKKLKDHQEKKLFEKDDNHNKTEVFIVNDNQIKDDKGSTRQSIQNSQDNKLSDVFEAIKMSSSSSSVIDTSNIKQPDDTGNIQIPEADVNITEILIANKRNLELQVLDLQSKLGKIEENYAILGVDYKMCSHKLNELENELRNINDKYLNANKEILLKDSKLQELNSVKLLLTEENSNLSEQLEFTKTVLNAKEAENDSLHNQLFNLQNQYDVIHLQLQQLTNGSPCPPSAQGNNKKTEVLLQKISNLEQQLSVLQKERDQINLHYEHYVAELNEQLKSVIKKNEELTREVENLLNRENSLIEQISDMEIRIQKYNFEKKRMEVDSNTTTLEDIVDKYKNVQDELNRLQNQHTELQNQYAESVARVKELSEVKETECNHNHENISLSKLNADMTSDKVAAQRATEQNKKLKQDLQRLEDAFVKMSKDKLELTEKISAEKYLNRELTIKLSEVDEKAKEMQIKLKAKDEEMIRLQSNYREIEKQCEKLMNLDRNDNIVPEVIDASLQKNNDRIEENNVIVEQSGTHLETDVKQEVDDKNSLQRADAMSKLQDRFLKIMEEVANLSDEKHRLEHIIMQLQNETDTICEYVALYQQQRSLLKCRDEERSSQLKIFQQECGKLKCELEELAGILTRFAEDKNLSFYFETESKRNDMEKVMTLLYNLKNNSLIDTNKKNIEFKNFYPCNCCSGKLIDV